MFFEIIVGVPAAIVLAESVARCCGFSFMPRRIEGSAASVSPAPAPEANEKRWVRAREIAEAKAEAKAGLARARAREAAASVSPAAPVASAFPAVPPQEVSSEEQRREADRKKFFTLIYQMRAKEELKDVLLELRKLIRIGNIDLNVGKRDATPLMSLLRKGCIKASRILLEAGADPNGAVYTGSAFTSALECCCKYKSKKLIKLLRRYNGSPDFMKIYNDLTDPDNNEVRLAMCVIIQEKSDCVIKRYIKRCKPDINTRLHIDEERHCNRVTLLIQTVINVNYNKSCRFLLAIGADMDEENFAFWGCGSGPGSDPPFSGGGPWGTSRAMLDDSNEKASSDTTSLVFKEVSDLNILIEPNKGGDDVIEQQKQFLMEQGLSEEEAEDVLGISDECSPSLSESDKEIEMKPYTKFEEIVEGNEDELSVSLPGIRNALLDEGIIVNIEEETGKSPGPSELFVGSAGILAALASVVVLGAAKGNVGGLVPAGVAAIVDELVN